MMSLPLDPKQSKIRRKYSVPPLRLKISFFFRLAAKGQEFSEHKKGNSKNLFVS